MHARSNFLPVMSFFRITHFNQIPLSFVVQTTLITLIADTAFISLTVRFIQLLYRKTCRWWQVIFSNVSLRSVSVVTWNVLKIHSINIALDMICNCDNCSWNQTANSWHQIQLGCSWTFDSIIQLNFNHSSVGVCELSREHGRCNYLKAYLSLHDP